jgi:hypothetical protein
MQNALSFIENVLDTFFPCKAHLVFLKFLKIALHVSNCDIENKRFHVQIQVQKHQYQIFKWKIEICDRNKTNIALQLNE